MCGSRRGILLEVKESGDTTWPCAVWWHFNIFYIFICLFCMTLPVNYVPMPLLSLPCQPVPLHSRARLPFVPVIPKPLFPVWADTPPLAFCFPTSPASALSHTQNRIKRKNARTTGESAKVRRGRHKAESKSDMKDRIKMEFVDNGNLWKEIRAYGVHWRQNIKPRPQLLKWAERFNVIHFPLIQMGLGGMGGDVQVYVCGLGK